MTDAYDADDYATVTSSDLARFEEHASAALVVKRASFSSEVGDALELVVRGGAPIAGLLWFDWSAEQMLLFLLVGAWTAILCDVAKLVLVPEPIERAAKEKLDHWHVWVVAKALRDGTRRAPRSHLNVQYMPWMGVMVDFLCGGVGTVLSVLAVTLRGKGGPPMRPLVEQGVAWSIAALVAWQLATTIWDVVRARRSGDKTIQVSVSPGLRGVGLFLLMGVVVCVREQWGDGGSVAHGAMLAVNGVVAAFGLFLLLMVRESRREAKWLEEYLITKRGRS